MTLEALTAMVGQPVTLTRSRNGKSDVRMGVLEKIKPVGNRTMMIVHQPEREGQKYGNYYLDECTINPTMTA